MGVGAVVSSSQSQSSRVLPTDRSARTHTRLRHTHGFSRLWGNFRDLGSSQPFFDLVLSYQ